MKRFTLRQFENRFFNEITNKQVKQWPWSNVKVSSRREEQCRKILEDIFHDKFPSVRPRFLRNPKTGQSLELDGYNEKLGIAFEYQGEQHYSYIEHFHNNNYNKFLLQQERDKYKKQKCEELKIHLILIPYYIEDLNYYIRANLESLIAQRLRA